MRSPNPNGGLALGAIAAALVAVWLVALPSLTPRYATDTRRLENAGIDPGALFYTDHPRAGK